jgi:hypothetical protein
MWPRNSFSGNICFNFRHWFIAVSNMYKEMYSVRTEMFRYFRQKIYAMQLTYVLILTFL